MSWSDKIAKWLGAVRRFYWKRVATDWQRANHYARLTDQRYSHQIAEAEKSGNLEHAEELNRDWAEEGADDQDEIDRLTTVYWQRKANGHRVPLPKRERPYWIESSGHGGRLTIAGIDFIESRIDEKRKRRWEFWFLWAPALTGLIGALTGLLAIVLH